MSIQFASTDTLATTTSLPQGRPMSAIVSAFITDLTLATNFLGVSTASLQEWGFGINSSATGHLYYYNATQKNGTVATLPTNQWHTFGLTVSSAADGDVVNLYYDGENHGTAVVTAQNLASQTTFTIGKDTIGDQFIGSMAGVKVWNRELAPEEIEIESKYILPVFYNDLWDYWHLLSLDDMLGFRGNLLVKTGTPGSSANNPKHPWQYVPKKYFFAPSPQDLMGQMCL